MSNTYTDPDRLVFDAAGLNTYYGQPSRLNRYVRVTLGGVSGRLFFEEVGAGIDSADAARAAEIALVATAQTKAAQAVAAAQAETAALRAELAVHKEQTMNALDQLADSNEELTRLHEQHKEAIDAMVVQHVADNNELRSSIAALQPVVEQTQILGDTQ
jgi:hypothetical protein